jgi:hypothetical protein
MSVDNSIGIWPHQSRAHLALPFSGAREKRGYGQGTCTRQHVLSSLGEDIVSWPFPATGSLEPVVHWTSSHSDNSDVGYGSETEKCTYSEDFIVQRSDALSVGKSWEGSSRGRNRGGRSDVTISKEKWYPIH